MTIAVIGLWHQGVVAAACLADMGHDVVGIDGDAARIRKLNTGAAPIFEPGLDDLVSRGLRAGSLRFTGDLRAGVQAATHVLVAFDTPVNEDDESDLTEIFRTFEIMAPALAPDAVVLVTAQVPVGTCDQLAERVAAATGRPPRMAYMPENLRLGQAIERFRAPPLPIVGCDRDDTFDLLMQVLSPLAPQWHRVSLRTAEMMKHALNGYLAVTVCFANELGNICDAVGADGGRIGELLRLEPRVGSKAMLRPGLGFSGGTLARDMTTLRKLGDRYAIETPLLDGAWRSNQTQNDLVLRKLGQSLPSLSGSRIAVLGLTYKPDTSTLRRSAALEVIQKLAAAGAKVKAHDPRADRDELRAYGDFELCADALGALDDAAALVLMTPWAEYRDIDFAEAKRRMARPLVIDTANMWNADELIRLGFDYDDIGSGRHPREL